MNLLLLDTSTKSFSLAVAAGDKILASKNLVLEKILSSSIIPTIKNVLHKADIDLSAIDGFGVGLGPGSFTSLRVGVSTVKGLAFALNKPVVGISSLDVIATGLPGDYSSLCVICDARRDLVYACFYEKVGKRLKQKSDYMLLPPVDVIKKIKEKTIFVGDGITMLAKENLVKENFVLADENFWFPNAKNLFPLVIERFIEQEYDDIDKLVPLYLYPEDCQVQKKE